MSKEKNSICVSIFMITYNQENYIAQAIEGVLQQKTNFKFQLVIGEDYSSDSTREICKQYAQKYPDKIKLLLAEENLGLIANYVRTFRECTGKYVAICDGDDYWVDSLKLQKQVDIMENRPEISIVHSKYNLLLPSGEFIKNKGNGLPNFSSFEDLVFENRIYSVTVLFRNRSLPEKMSKWLLKFPYGDWPTYLWVITEGGKLFFMEEATAVYRKDIGISSGLMKRRSRIGEINLGILQEMAKDEMFSCRFGVINQSVLKHKLGLMSGYNKEGRFLKSIFLMLRFIRPDNFFRVFHIYFYSLKRTLQINNYVKSEK